MPRVGCVDSGKMPRLSINSGSRVALCLSPAFNFYSSTTEAKEGPRIKKGWVKCSDSKQGALLLTPCLMLDGPQRPAQLRVLAVPGEKDRQPHAQRSACAKTPTQSDNVFPVVAVVVKCDFKWTPLNAEQLAFPHRASGRAGGRRWGGGRASERPCSLRSPFNRSPMWSQLGRNAEHERIKASS